jgi:hypothetical protein
MQNGCRNRLVTFGTLLALLKCVRASRKTKEIPKERSKERSNPMKVKTNTKAGSALWGS